jgi:hypothetical protein
MSTDSQIAELLKPMFCKPDDDHYGVGQVTGAFAWNWYWLESTHDGIYAFGSGALIDPADASHARYLGNQGDLEIRWAPCRIQSSRSTLPALSQGHFSKR